MFNYEKAGYKNQCARFLVNTMPHSAVSEPMASAVSDALSAVAGEVPVSALMTLPVSVHFANTV